MSRFCLAAFPSSSACLFSSSRLTSFALNWEHSVWYFCRFWSRNLFLLQFSELASRASLSSSSKTSILVFFSCESKVRNMFYYKINKIFHITRKKQYFSPPRSMYILISLYTPAQARKQANKHTHVHIPATHISKHIKSNIRQKLLDKNSRNLYSPHNSSICCWCDLSKWYILEIPASSSVNEVIPKSKASHFINYVSFTSRYKTSFHLNSI